MRAEITIEKFQDFNTMTNRQRKEFERLLNEELSKPENQKIINEINEKLKAYEPFKS